MTLLSMSSRSSVDRAPARCSGGHGFDSCRGLRIFLCPTLVSCGLIHLDISLPSLKFTIFINLSLLTMTSIALILAVCRTPVIYELREITLLSMSSRSSVDRAPARYMGGHGFDSCRGLRIFLCPTLVSC